jgi:hypothetical protein
MLNSKISFNGIFKALDISKKAAKDVPIKPLSILLICEISTPISLASCSCVKFAESLKAFRLFQSLNKKSLWSFFFTKQNCL